MKIAKINKTVSFSLLFCLIIFSCRYKKDTIKNIENSYKFENQGKKENLIITQLLDSIILNNDKFYLILEYSTEKKYKLRHKNVDYTIPYFFIVGKDTLDLSDIKLDISKKNNLMVHIFQGNSGLYTYKFDTDAKLRCIIKNNKDSLYVNNRIDSLQEKTKKQIIEFINE